MDEIKMDEINISVKSIINPHEIFGTSTVYLPLTIVNPRTVYLPQLYAKVYWKMMELNIL